MSNNSNSFEQTNTIGKPRYGCAIAALYTAVAIPGAVPITHCGPGCVDKQHVGFSVANGMQGGGGAIVPSVNAGEKEIVFGGEKKLRELIRSTLKIMKGDLFVVLGGCTGELVGDDIGSVVSEFQQKGVPIVYAETGGFKGNNLIGHEIVIKAIIDQFVGKYEGEKEKGLINVFSEVPYYNTFWNGDLTEIKRILEGAGFKVNILFGCESNGVSEWKEIPKAQFNLLLSPWVGLKTVKHLEKKYGQPYLHIPAVPIGAKETSEFLRKVTDFAGINKENAEKFIEKEEKRYYYYLNSFSEFYSEYTYGLPAKYVVVGDSLYNLSLNRFLVNQLGLIPLKQIIVDNPPNKYREFIKNEYENLAEDVSAEADFIEDGYIIDKTIDKMQFGSLKPIILGAGWERDISRKYNAVFLEISFPANHEVVINRSYVGYNGALNLIERIYSKYLSLNA
ncbi:MAG: nitrogenase component 1 [Clostridium sp.]